MPILNGNMQDKSSSDCDDDSGISIPLPSTAAHNIPLLSSSRGNNLLKSGSTEPTQQQLLNDPEQKEAASSHTRHAKLQQSIVTLQSQIEIKNAELARNIHEIRQHEPKLELADDEAVLHDAQQIVLRHIKLLHHYNEIKDIGLGLMGLIADKDGKRLGDVMKEREMSDKD